MTSRPAALATAAIAALALTACGTTADAAVDGKRQIVTSFYPLELVARQVAGPWADVSVLTKPGAEPHDLELTAQDLARATRADLVVYAKGFQPAVDEGLQEVEAPRVLDVSGSAHLDVEGSEEHGGEHPDEHGAEQPDGHEGESAEEHAAHAGADPHFWLDPERYADVARAVQARLAADDPAHAADYARNADAFVARLEALDAEFRAGLRSCRGRTLVTSHAAFAYLAQRYGLEQHGISGVSPEAEPSASALKELSDLVRREGVTTIYQETLVEPQFARTVAGTTGATVATLDPVEGITPASAGRDYFEVMRANLAALRTGLGCS